MQKNTSSYRLHAIWDPFIRIVHWWMAFALLMQFITGVALQLLDGVLPESAQDQLDQAHYLIGYGFAAALVARLFWLFAGPSHARWRELVPITPEQRNAWLATLRYYASGFRAKPPRSYAHNAFAGPIYLAFFTIAATQIIMGIVLSRMPDDQRMHSSLLEWHEAGFYLLLGFVIAHVTAVVLRELRDREGLISAMIHGYKVFPETVSTGNETKGKKKR
jgi:Ni/Fe-hydrogenase 1 B-type cytochrome subunit